MLTPCSLRKWAQSRASDQLVRIQARWEFGSGPRMDVLQRTTKQYSLDGFFILICCTPIFLCPSFLQAILCEKCTNTYLEELCKGAAAVLVMG